eukprot:gnl/MRDRNA2_/MRDRNA2_17541_c0_seq1.p1 gnl/MRDRNA2_/MRDRNA2_17541_c0~~gnl/MRDRNA2_/MRDRNA2_17541_c0_seq1.p1  ORF type:complete len:313 (+),score=55.06 gnl/MRDRNA2_/MRDRNA2_17541_c0_seq1:24-941(+)
MGPALMFLLGFRLNTALQKWTRGRSLWTEITVACRDLMRLTSNYVDDDDIKCSMCAYLMAFSIILRFHLRRKPLMQSFVSGLLTHDEVSALNNAHHPPSMCLDLISGCLSKAVAQKKITVPIVVLENRVATLSKATGECEQIELTPMPFGYVVQYRTLTLFWLLTLPIVLVKMLSWLTIPINAIIALIILGFERTAVDVEYPFGTDSNDLAMDTYVAEIQEECAEVLLRHVDFGFPDSDVTCTTGTLPDHGRLNSKSAGPTRGLTKRERNENAKHDDEEEYHNEEDGGDDGGDDGNAGDDGGMAL